MILFFSKSRERLPSVAALLLCLSAAVAWGGCGEGVYTGRIDKNLPPVVEISNGPVEGDTTKYHVHFFWKGNDPDGNVSHFEVALAHGDPTGFDPQDTVGTDKWTRTIATDSILVVSADQFNDIVMINQRPYSFYDRTHTFFVRAVDDRGAVSNTAYRSFTGWTLAPQVRLTQPYMVNPGSTFQVLSPITTYSWTTVDPIDYPWNHQDADSTRYLWHEFYKDIVYDMNASPELFEERWSHWKALDAPGDSGISTVIGDDEVVPEGDYIFAVQAMDEAGAVTSIFDEVYNVRRCKIVQPTGPVLTIYEPYLGSFTFMGSDMNPGSRLIPPQFELNFSWDGSANQYGATVSTFRYGWDIVEFDDPAQWETIPSPYVLVAKPKIFASGVHTLYVECVDNLGIVTIGVVDIEVISAAMTRELLWVDDFRSEDFNQVLYAFPTETEHDEFWMDICMRVPGFNPTRDVFDVAEHGIKAPPLKELFKYKNVIWSFSGAADASEQSSWNSSIVFKPKEIYPREANLNIIQYYMAYGGHIWSEGHSHRTGGLGAVLSDGLEVFPSYLKYDTVPYWVNPPFDTLGVKCIAYRDYCVSVIDKIDTQLKWSVAHLRRLEWDGFKSAYRDDDDSYSAGHYGMPSKLELWDKVTEKGMFFDPMVRGFTYVEIYDPQYWMNYIGISSQSCIHPIFRMKARSTVSLLNDQTIAFWTSKYENQQPPGETSVLAPSIHFGVPLWFFNRAQVDSIASVIFRTWQID